MCFFVNAVIGNQGRKIGFVPIVHRSVVLGTFRPQDFHKKKKGRQIKRKRKREDRNRQRKRCGKEREKARQKIGRSQVRKTRPTDPGQPEPRTREGQPILFSASTFGPAQLQRPKPQTSLEVTVQLNQPETRPMVQSSRPATQKKTFRSAQ